MDRNRREGEPDFSEENAWILQRALRAGLLDGNSMARAAAAAREGSGIPVGVILIGEGFCTQEGFLELVSGLETKILLCANCGSFKKSARPLEPHHCDVCDGSLGLYEFELLVEEERSTGPPSGGERYARGSEIGRGGLGRVMSAKDRLLDREVAIKEMIRGRESKVLLKRFLKEGEIAGRLTHPNVIPIHDIGLLEEDGEKVPYFVMTRIRGRDLDEILKSLRKGDEEERREYPRVRLLGIFQDVCQAVAYAHDHGVVHRDLKPANIMVGEYGEVYVVDWGLAKVKGEEEGAVSHESADAPPSSRWRVPEPAEIPAEQTLVPIVTLDGEILGTPSYMPPEQAAGRNEEIDERSDIYSLGAVLYEILAHRPPHRGSSRDEVLTQVVGGVVRPPSVCVRELREERIEAEDSPPAFLEDVPEALEQIVMKAVAKRKEDRYA
jgi:serine/threonine protein kinase